MSGGYTYIRCVSVNASLNIFFFVRSTAGKRELEKPEKNRRRGKERQGEERRVDREEKGMLLDLENREKSSTKRGKQPALVTT